LSALKARGEAQNDNEVLETVRIRQINAELVMLNQERLSPVIAKLARPVIT
jgi:hypothetical protein